MRSLPSLSWAVIALAVCSCMTYQHVTLSSDLNENDTHEFIYDNDSVLIRYNFNGANCPVSLYLENKLDVPLYIDWKRSSIIQNNQSKPYWQDQSIIRGTADGNSTYSFFSNPQSFSTTAEINGAIYRNESVTFLPPHSYKRDNMISLETEMIRTPGSKQDYTKTIPTAAGKAKVYYFGFGKEDTPRHYRSFLTLSTNSSFEQVFTIDHEFWVSEVTETWLGPASFSKEKNNGNRYYLTKSTGAGTALGVMAILVLLLAIVSAQQ